MNKIWAFIFRRIPVIKHLDGYKTYIGILFLFCAYGEAFLGEVIGAFPNTTMYLLPVQAVLKSINATAPHLDTLGWIVTPVGLVDKVVKSDQDEIVEIDEKEVN